MAPSPLDSALTLVRHGLRVVPASGDAKRPLPPGWTRRAAANEDEAAALFAAYPGADAVAVVTGGTLAALDVDPRSGGDEASLYLDHGTDWQRTVTARTPGGGRHYYFRVPDGLAVRTTAGTLAPGMDTRGAGGCVIAPTSTTKRGAYQWEPGYSPDDVPLAPAPPFLLSLARRTRNEAQRATKKGQGADGASRNISTCTTPPSPTLPVAHALHELDRNASLVAFAASHLGIVNVVVGASFQCLLHEDARPSAALFRMDDGRVMYHDFHRTGHPEEWLSLAEVFAAQTTGKVRKLNAPEHLTWRLRLLVDSGLADPAPVPLPVLPEGADYPTRRVYAGVLLLFGCKWLYGPGEPSALSWRFLADWCGIAQSTAAKGLQDLVGRRVLIVAGDHRAAYGKTMTTYLPGDAT